MQSNLSNYEERDVHWTALPLPLTFFLSTIIIVRYLFRGTS